MKFTSQVKSCAIIYLMVSCFLFSTITTLNAFRKIKRDDTVTKEKVEGALGNSKYVMGCINAMVQSIGPEFCMDAGVIPTGCPDGYYRQGALCYLKCGDEYDLPILGVCWQKCTGDFKDIGAICSKGAGWNDWFWKKSKVTESLTNLDSRITCPDGMKKEDGEALCYHKCEDLGMEKCGIAACAKPGGSCAKAITGIIVDVVSGVIDLSLFIASLGGSTVVKTATEAFKQIGKKAFRAGLDVVKNAVAKAVKNKIQDKLFRDGFLFIVKQTFAGMGSNLINAVCQKVWEQVNTPKIENIINQDMIIGIVDVANIKGSMAACKEGMTENQKIECARNILTGASTFDPTGVLTIAKAFLQPQCKHIERKKTPEQENAELAQKYLQQAKEGCMFIFDECKFRGTFKEICANTPNLGEFKDKTSSFVTGPNTNGILFNLEDYNGKHMTFGPSTSVPCLRDVKKDKDNLLFDNMTKSVRFNTARCLIITYSLKDKTPDKKYNIIICDDKDLPKTIPDNLSSLSAHFVTEKLTKVTLTNEKSQSIEIKGSQVFDPAKLPFKTVVKAKFE